MVITGGSSEPTQSWDSYPSVSSHLLDLASDWMRLEESKEESSCTRSNDGNYENLPDEITNSIMKLCVGDKSLGDILHEDTMKCPVTSAPRS
ncbi:hypothetical protein MKW98_015734 [Papaver atlanticum]|uniref:Uncharacterized protein n=1 Tax=Papaver atlanticum TaxID=357466 RepID=A0AAD4SMM0_9MAGN|nr:hypothetical protein MKW98_015734 [Papaver atlanticum]